ncbi:hypothetical protein TCDM_12529 [Trypanosoma cruzi Dm28c]|uniref:Mucin TcMUCII n=1 Tax=Trypanosoma cruzi Dm28c TaxID=1416333 RepID=V5AV10_TRYCR|nr:hypothetical protein TCDM_12529 [Trypanosoma cruzi Dm28c]
MRHLPTLRQAGTRPADHKEPSVSVVPSLPDCGDRPASASAGTSSRREHRNSLSTSERRIDVLLLKLQQSALVRPQYEGTCRTCSAWRSDILRGPPMRMPQWRHRLLNRCLARRSPPKLPSMPAGETRRKHKRGYSRWTRLFRHRLITDATGCSSRRTTGDSASSTAGMPSSLRTGTATVCGCPSPHDGILSTFVLTVLALLTRYCSSMQPKQDNKLLCDEYWLHFPWANNPHGVRGSLLLLLCFCVAVCAAPPLVCVCTLCGGVPARRTALAVCTCGGALCAAPVCFSLLHLSVCVCVPVAVDWSVCRAWCAAHGACLAAALSSCGVPSVCVCRTSRLSVALHAPHCADQLHTTELPHSR